MSEEEEGHEKDMDEDESEFIDRQFSRDNFWGPVIALAMMEPVKLTVINATPGGWVIDVLAFLILTPFALYCGLMWPRWEKKYAKYLPWMTAETP